MKQVYIIFSIAISMCLTTTIFAQSTNNHTEDKKVVVVKKTIDAEGNTVVTTTTTNSDTKEIMVEVISNETNETNESHDEKVIKADNIWITEDVSEGENGAEVIIIKKTIDSDGNTTIEKTVTSDGNKEVQVDLIIKDEHDAEEIRIIEIGEGEGDMLFISDDGQEDEMSIEKIITIDDNGNQNIEVIINGEEGAEDVRVFKVKVDDLHEGHEMKNVNVEVNEDEHGKTIKIKADGKTEVIKLGPGEELSEEKKKELSERGIYIMDGNDHGAMNIHSNEEFMWISDSDKNTEEGEFVFDYNFEFDKEKLVEMMGTLPRMGNSNCVALGVFAGTTNDNGVKISGIIDGSGAQDAGLQSGDIVKSIGEEKINSNNTLIQTLGNYEPGQVVSVTFERNGAVKTIDAELRAWRDLPDYKTSWRANIKCGEEGPRGGYEFHATSPEVTKRIIIIKKSKDVVVDEEEAPGLNASPIIEKTNYDYSLNLDNFSAYPNPTDGKFTINFEGEAKPVTVSVFDASGKEIYRDNVKDFDGIYNKEVNLRGMSRGAMILSVAQDGKRFSDQIIIQ